MGNQRYLLRGLTANFIGQAISAVANFAFIPAYIAILGMEAFGLIGLFTVLLTAANLLDAGMTPTLNREMAAFRAGKRDASDMRNLLFSVLLLSFAVLLLASAMSIALAPMLAEAWLPASHINPQTVAAALTLMSIVAFLRVIEGLLRGVLLGLQRPVLMNAIVSAIVLARAGGVLIPLAFFSSIATFFIWQAVVCLIGIVVLIVNAYRAIGPSSHAVKFDASALFRLRGFAGGIVLVSLLAVILGQSDKIILLRSVSLTDFGYYSVCVALCGILYQAALPISQAYYPQFTIQYEQGNEVALERSYHQAVQMVSVLVGSAVAFVFTFSAPILLTWSGKSDVALHGGPILRLLVIAAGFHCLMYIPYMLQLAAGWSRLAVVINSVLACLYLPALWLATARYGAFGAAWALLCCNCLAVSATSIAMHRRLLAGHWLVFVAKDVAPPVIAAVISATILATLMPQDGQGLVELVKLGFAGAVILGVTGFASPDIRKIAGQFFSSFAHVITR